MSADPRESPEWAEYERLLLALINDECVLGDMIRDDDSSSADRAAAYVAVDVARDALDAFVLWLLERREPATLREDTLEQLRQIAQIPTAGPIVTVRLTPPESRSILAHVAGEP